MVQLVANARVSETTLFSTEEDVLHNSSMTQKGCCASVNLSTKLWLASHMMA